MFSTEAETWKIGRLGGGGKVTSEVGEIALNGIATEADLLSTLASFERLGVPCWLDGGWGVDVLTGRPNREHRDIDIDFDAAHTEQVVSELEAAGYVIVVEWMPSRMELRHDRHGYLDIHPISFNADGSITQADPNGGEYTFQKEWFSSAEYKGQQIPCISREAQMLFHSGYELTFCAECPVAAFCAVPLGL